MSFSRLLIKFEFHYVPSLWIFVRQWSYLRNDIGILDSLLLEWNGSKVISLKNFSNILLKFSIVFEDFCTFLNLAIITGQRNLILADGLHDKTPLTKNVSEHFFTAKLGKFSFEFCFCSFLCDLVTNKARKLEV